MGETAETGALMAQAPASDQTDANGVRKLPFASPHPSAQIPAKVSLSSLTAEQRAKYEKVYETVSGWETVPTSPSAKASTTAITDEERMWLTQDCLLRYLRATKWKVGESIERIQSTLGWRREYGLVPAATSKIQPDYISIENETGKQFIVGYDNEGCPCLYLNPSRQNTQRSDRQVEHLVFMLERCIDLMPPCQETIALMINFSETKNGQNASIQQGRQTLSILQNHYPERLGKALVHEPPWHVWAFLKVILPFVDPVTRAKIVFERPIRDFVPPDHLQITHGGELKFEYDHSVYWPEMNKMAKDRRDAIYERWVRGGKKVGELEAYLKGAQEESLKHQIDDGLAVQQQRDETSDAGANPSTTLTENFQEQPLVAAGEGAPTKNEVPAPA